MKQENKVLKRARWPRTRRPFDEVLEALHEYRDKVWYNWHKIFAERIDRGEAKLVSLEEWEASQQDGRMPPANLFLRKVWVNAERAARRIAKKYDIKHTGPCDDFECGMINGKLSTLRWILGDEWDVLDV